MELTTKSDLNSEPTLADQKKLSLKDHTENAAKVIQSKVLIIKNKFINRLVLIMQQKKNQKMVFQVFII